MGKTRWQHIRTGRNLIIKRDGGIMQKNGSYADWIAGLRHEWTGKRVMYEGAVYKVTDVDYNGFLLIDKKSKYNDTIAVSQYKIAEVS